MDYMTKPEELQSKLLECKIINRFSYSNKSRFLDFLIN